tara:strand:+ start:2217 stop:2561 length:345 start_codon:yes stop_codon:yes gene_type:complete
MSDNEKKKRQVLKFEAANEELIKSLSLHTALIEAFDWDEEAAIGMFEKALDTLINLYEYSQYDKKLIRDNEEYLKLLRTNLPEMTDIQFTAIHELLDFKMKEGTDALPDMQNLN